jgi:hypothetical protein
VGAAQWFARVTAYRWFRAGLLPVPAVKVGRLILVDEPTADTGVDRRTAVYARVSSADQKVDLDRQVARVTAWATGQQIPVDQVVTEVGPALNGHRRNFWHCCAIHQCSGLSWNIETDSAGSARSTSRLRWPHRAESWWLSTPLRLMTTWCGI